MGFDLAPYLTLPKAVQPQGKLRLNRGHPLAPLNGVFLQEAAVGQLKDYVSGRISAPIGSTVTSGIIAQGRYVNYASTGRHEVAIPAGTNSLTIACGFTGTGASNARLAEFYTSSAKTTAKGRFYINGTTLMFEVERTGGAGIWALAGVSANARHSAVVLWDGGTVAGSCIMIVDGIQYAPTFTDAGSAVIAGTFAYAVVGNRTAGDRPLTGKLDYFWLDVRARSIAECLSIANAPYQMLERDLPPIIGVTVAGGGITASIAITEAADTFATSSNVAISASIAKTDPADLLASTSTVAISGSIAIADPVDVLAIVSTVGISGSITLSEIADTFAASSNLAISGSLALTDTDVFASVANVAISGSLAITEGPDIFAASVTVGNSLTASITVTEAADAFAASAGVGISGALSIADQADTLAAQIALAISGAVAASETGDTLAASGTVAISASLARTDTDLPAALVNVAISGITSITDPADVFAAVLAAYAIAAASERILSVQAENRSMSVAAEPRTISMSTESRTLTIKAE